MSTLNRRDRYTALPSGSRAAYEVLFWALCDCPDPVCLSEEPMAMTYYRISLMTRRITCRSLNSLGRQ